MEGANQMSEDKPTHRYLKIKLLRRIDELAAADKRSRTNWLTLQIERIAQQRLTERPA
jgi:hypothetical protein